MDFLAVVKISKRQRDNILKEIVKLLVEVRKGTEITKEPLNAFERSMSDIRSRGPIECVYFSTAHGKHGDCLYITMIIDRKTERTDDYEIMRINEELGYSYSYKEYEPEAFERYGLHLYVFLKSASYGIDKNELFNSTILYDPTGKYKRLRDEVRFSGYTGPHSAAFYFSNGIIVCPPIDVVEQFEAKIIEEQTPSTSKNI